MFECSALNVFRSLVGDLCSTALFPDIAILPNYHQALSIWSHDHLQGQPGTVSSFHPSHVLLPPVRSDEGVRLSSGGRQLKTADIGVMVSQLYGDMGLGMGI